MDPGNQSGGGGGGAVMEVGGNVVVALTKVPNVFFFFFKCYLYYQVVKSPECHQRGFHFIWSYHSTK